MPSQTLSKLGFSNNSVYSNYKREENDFYATDPRATRKLIEIEEFSQNIWEPACGKGHISEVFIENGFNVYSSDLIDRGYTENIKDFLDMTELPFEKCDIVTNPPFKYALEFIQHSLDLLKEGSKAIFLLKIQFLEGKVRKEFFAKNPPKRVQVSSSRLQCAKDGNFEKYHANTICYAWYIWEKGYTGDTILKWF